MEEPHRLDFGFEAHWFFHKPVDIDPSSYSSQDYIMLKVEGGE